MSHAKAQPTVPRHLGFILDGNRRWARAQGLKTLEGHSRGAEVFRDIALATFDRGVKYVSAYVFSNENWSRTKEEVGYLMNLVLKATEKYLDTFDKANIKIVILGRREGLGKNVLAAIERTEQKTKDNTRGTLALCFNYSGRVELTDAVRQLIAEGHTPQDITPEVLAGALYEPEVPPLDLIVRTSGERRISDFMLFRAAYAELHFCKAYWPDFTEADLDAALQEYARRERRIGK